MFFFSNWFFFLVQATWSSITHSQRHYSVLQLLNQQKHNLLPVCWEEYRCLPICFDSLLLFSSLSLFHRPRETKEMSRYRFVLRLPVHRLLLHHRPLGENHPGSPRHRDQRHTLLLPDALHCAVTHLPQVSVMEGLKRNCILYFKPKIYAQIPWINTQSLLKQVQVVKILWEPCIIPLAPVDGKHTMQMQCWEGFESCLPTWCHMFLITKVYQTFFF